VYLVFVFKSREKVKTIAALQLELCQLLPNSSIVKKNIFQLSTRLYQWIIFNYFKSTLIFACNL